MKISLIATHDRVEVQIVIGVSLIVVITEMLSRYLR